MRSTSASTSLARSPGGRGEPYAYYSVQVKSTPGPWVFDGPGAVRWILGYPAPLLFCIVDKPAAQFTIYQLRARFDAAAMTDHPASLRLVPGEPGRNRTAPRGTGHKRGMALPHRMGR